MVVTKYSTINLYKKNILLIIYTSKRKVCLHLISLLTQQIISTFFLIYSISIVYNIEKYQIYNKTKINILVRYLSCLNKHILLLIKCKQKCYEVLYPILLDSFLIRFSFY